MARMRAPLEPRIAGVLLAGAIGVAGCTGGGDAGKRAPSEPRRTADGAYIVEIADDGYSPRRLTIGVGERVTFVNRSPSTPHSAQDERRGEVDGAPGEGPTDHSGNDVNYAYKRGFATHSLFPGEPQTVVFRVPRTYVYHCTFHPEMTGVIRVVRGRAADGVSP